jgi:hypothetical protein
LARHAELAELDIPEFGLPTVEPVIPPDTYRSRLRALIERAAEEGYDVFAVYGDREHYANIAYLTGYDPRFEEALLLMNVRKPDAKPVLLVGNEGIGYAGISPIKEDIEVVLYQSFSLPGQPRGSSPNLEEILRRSGAGKGSRVGVAGWKYYSNAEIESPEMRLEVPSYIAEAMRGVSGHANILNANRLLTDPGSGLRTVNDVDQLARFEFAAAHTSQAIRDLIFKLRPGMTEYEAVRLMRLNGMPLSCHLMLSAGPRAFMGLPSPSSRVIRVGDPLTMAYGAWGALNARAGFVVKEQGELPTGIRDYVERLVTPYFEAVADWYGHIRIGVRGEELYDVIHSHIGEPFFGVHLNPGHLIHLDEWVSSPFYEGSDMSLKSGMALQADIIPATGTNYFTTNIEDGIALADGGLRNEYASRYPEAWSRIQARRRFMQEELGISLKPEVLPFSNIPAYLPPFLLSPRKAMRMVD